MKQESLVKNYSYKLIYQIVTFMIPLISTPYISRVFGAEGVGIQSYTNAIVSYFVLFAALGTEIYGAIEIAKVRDNEEKLSVTFWGIVFVRFFTTGFCLISWLVYTYFSSKYKAYYSILSLQVFSVALDITWFYEGLEKYKIIVMRSIAIKFFNLLFLFLFIKDSKDLWLYIGSLGIFTVLGNLSLWLNIFTKVSRIKWRDVHIREHIRGTLIYFIPTIATSIYTVLDKAMIGWITGSESQNGYYEQASGIINLVKKVTVTLPVVMRARMAYLFSVGRLEEVKDKLYKSLNFIVTISFLFAFGLMGLAKQLVPWYLGEGYEAVILLLYLKSPLIFIIALSMCIGEECLTPSGQRARSSKAIIVGSVVNFLLNLMLIPHYGADGAAISSVLAEALITSLYIYMGKEYLSIGKIWKCIWKKMIAALLMFAFLLIVYRKAPSKWYITILQMGSGFVVYIGILLITRDSIFRDILLILRKEKKNE